MSAEARAQREKDRSVTNMRNKDRPSLQIYQPGKRRVSSTSGPDAGDSKGQTSPENECNEYIDIEKPSSSSKSCCDTRKRTDAKDSSKSQNDDRKKVSNDKRISRYSEKRNKAKEKRDLTDNPAVANDCNAITISKEENNDEMS